MLRFMTCVCLAIAAVPAPGQDDAAQKRADVVLAREMSRWVEHNQVIVDKEGLKKHFFPLLGLGEKDRVEIGRFGFNTNGRFFMMHIRKASRSGKTTGLFEFGVDLERHRRTDDGGTLIFFEVRGGQTWGAPPVDHWGIVDLYDLGRGDFLVNDQQGRVVNSLSLPYELRWSPAHAFCHLLEAGKTVGQIIDERLDTLEKAGEGGEKYTEEAASRHKTFSQMRDKNQVIFKFE